jgi:NitT/TauT family transport system permease protein
MKKIHFDPRTLLPLAALAVIFTVHTFVPASDRYMLEVVPYYAYLLYSLTGVYGVWAVFSLFNATARRRLCYKALFIAMSLALLCVYDLITLKFALVSALYFPAPERIVEVFITDGFYILQCLVYSLRLLAGGFALGAITGVITGTCIGWSKRAHYWVMPFIRIVGPIPSTAWIPIALVVFIKPVDASIFLIALSVWFPTTVLTSSGIMNISKNYFEVSSALGASTLRTIFRVALPAAGPSIFTGLFNGASASFLTLMAAEMIGCKFGIGWYINWQRETLAYAHVYAALIVIAITFSLLISVQFKIRRRVLSWQKGMIRW